MSKRPYDELKGYIDLLPDSEDLLIDISNSSNLSIETQFFNNLISKFGDKLQLSKINYVSLEERIIDFIKKHPVSDLTPIKALGPYDGIINTNFGSAFIALISLNLSRANFIDEFKKKKKWNKPTIELFDYYLNKNPKDLYFLSIFGLQFYNIGFLDTDWLLKNIDTLLCNINDLEFEFFFGSYLFQHDSIALISLNEFRNRGLFKRYLTLDKKYQQYRCIKGYSWHAILNSFNEDNSLIDYLFEEKKIKYLNSIITEMWGLKKTENENSLIPYLAQQDKIILLWEYILEKSKIEPEVFTLIIGRIPLWINLLNEIKIETLNLIISSYTELKENKFYLQRFFEGLLSTRRTEIEVLNSFFDDFSKNGIIIPQATPFFSILENIARKHEKEEILEYYSSFFKIIHFTDSLGFIKWIIEKDKPNKIDLYSLEMSIIDSRRRQFFFTHLDKSGWFQPLIDSKILSLLSPLPYDFWFELNYLMKIKKNLQNLREPKIIQGQFNQFIKNILNIRPIPILFKNDSNSLSVFIELLAGASIELIGKEFKDFLRELQNCEASSFSRLEYQLIQHILPVFIEHKDKNLINFLLDFLFQYKTYESGETPYKNTQIKPVFDGYNISNTLLYRMSEIYAILGKDTFSIILKKIQELDKNVKNTFSYSLSFYLEKTTQRNLMDNDYNDLLIKFLEQYIKEENEENLNEIIEKMLESFSFQSIVLILFILLKKKEEMNLNYEPLLFHEQNFLNIYYLLYPNYLFLKEYANRFNPNHQITILNKIKELKFKEFRDSIDKNHYESFLLEKKKQLLLPLKKIESGVPEINDYHLELERKDNTRVGEILPSISGTVRIGGPKVDNQKLKKFKRKSVNEIRQDLDNYPIDDHGWKETSIAISLQNDIIRNPQKYLNDPATILKFRDDYMDFIISGFTEVFKKGTIQENREIICLYIDIISKEKKEEQRNKKSEFILYSLYFKLDPKITQLSHDIINLFIKLLDIIEKELKFTPFTKQTTSLNFINSNFYRYFEMYRKMSNFQEKQQENILLLQRQILKVFLEDEDNIFAPNACAYVSIYLFDFWYNNEEWVSSLWDILFQKYWDVSFPVFIKFGLRGYHNEIFNKFEEIQISNKIVENICDFESDNNFISNFCRYLMIRWYRDEIKITSDNIIFNSIKSCNYSLITVLIHEIFNLWKQAPDKGKPLIDYSWSKIIKVGVDMKQFEKISVMNRLIRWFETISELNDENFENVQKSVKECDSDSSLRRILKFLQKNIEKSPEMVGKLLLSIPLVKNLYYFSREEEFFPIISYLLKNDKKELASKIIERYAEKNILFLWEKFRNQY